ncbi:ABC transporter substrate-binding protein [Microvirga sp. W0021]|uniref:ABC transporter substrate-binding protein n=1 Tax=Hohaiivirga grylli TaxID=3133970 RepID=A0ABV0BJ88_9HYPH
MRTIKGFLATVLCLFAILAGGIYQAAAQESVTITHKLGTVTLKDIPKRVVIMDYGMLNSLDELIASGAVQKDLKFALPKQGLPDYMSKYKGDEYVDIGGLKDFNLETIYGFKPDLIIISGRQQDFYKDLSSIAPVWFVDSYPTDYMPGVTQNNRNLGKIFKAEAAVETALQGISSEIKVVHDLATAKNMAALVLLTNDGKISVYGSGSRFGIIYDVLGLKQADPNITTSLHGQVVNYEYIAEKNPDIIFVVDRSVAVSGKTDGLRILNNELVNGTNAAKNGKIIALDPGTWYLSSGGLQSLKMMVAEVKKAVE